MKGDAEASPLEIILRGFYCLPGCAFVSFRLHGGVPSLTDRLGDPLPSCVNALRNERQVYQPRLGLLKEQDHDISDRGAL